MTAQTLLRNDFLAKLTSDLGAAGCHRLHSEQEVAALEAALEVAALSYALYAQKHKHTQTPSSLFTSCVSFGLQEGAVVSRRSSIRLRHSVIFSFQHPYKHLSWFLVSLANKNNGGLCIKSGRAWISN